MILMYFCAELQNVLFLAEYFYPKKCVIFDNTKFATNTLNKQLPCISHNFYPKNTAKYG